MSFSMIGNLNQRPQRVVVTGAAGFIGSHLVDRLLSGGATVVGVDNLDPWYDPATKRENLAMAMRNPKFTLETIDLNRTHLTRTVADADVVYHLAGRPGVQDSWGDGFQQTCDANVAVTQRVFEAAHAASVGRVVLASSSSVYGDGASGDLMGSLDSHRLGQRLALNPISPYGVSKAAAEQLALVYGERGLDVVRLRYFTVFGPRQRPDMAMHRLFHAAKPAGTRFEKRGDGRQQREFTYVADVVDATIAAGTSTDQTVAGSVFDIGGGCTASLNDVITEIASITGRNPRLRQLSRAPGDPQLTSADLGPAKQTLNWHPATTMTDGLARQWAWHQRSPQSPLAIAESSTEPALING